MRANPVSRVRKALAAAGLRRKSHVGPILNPWTNGLVRLDWEPPEHEPPCYPQPDWWMEENEALTQQGLLRCTDVLQAAGFEVATYPACLVVSEPRLFPLQCSEARSARTSAQRAALSAAQSARSLRGERA
jgi:hypothetical protein